MLGELKGDSNPVPLAREEHHFLNVAPWAPSAPPSIAEAERSKREDCLSEASSAAPVQIREAQGIAGVFCQRRGCRVSFLFADFLFGQAKRKSVAQQGEKNAGTHFYTPDRVPAGRGSRTTRVNPVLRISQYPLDRVSKWQGPPMAQPNHLFYHSCYKPR